MCKVVALDISKLKEILANKANLAKLKKLRSKLSYRLLSINYEAVPKLS